MELRFLLKILLFCTVIGSWAQNENYCRKNLGVGLKAAKKGWEGALEIAWLCRYWDGIQMSAMRRW